MNEFEREFKETQLQLVKGKKGRKPDAKTEVLPVEVSDTESLLSLIIQTGDDMRVNGQAKYENNSEGLRKFKEKTTNYFRFLLEQNRNADDLGEVRLLPSVESWSLYLGVSRVCILQYEKRGDDWLSFISWVKNSIVAVKLQLAENHKLQPLLFLFDTLNNSPMYRNTNQIELVQVPDEKDSLTMQETPEVIAERYRARLADMQADSEN